MDYKDTAQEISKIVSKCRGKTPQNIEKIFFAQGADKSTVASIVKNITFLCGEFPEGGPIEIEEDLRDIKDRRKLDDIHNAVKSLPGIYNSIP